MLGALKIDNVHVAPIFGTEFRKVTCGCDVERRAHANHNACSRAPLLKQPSDSVSVFATRGIMNRFAHKTTTKQKLEHSTSCTVSREGKQSASQASRHGHTHTYTHTHTHTHTQTHTHTHKHKHKHTYTYTNTHAHTHTHKQTHIFGVAEGLVRKILAKVNHAVSKHTALAYFLACFASSTGNVRYLCSIAHSLEQRAFNTGHEREGMSACVPCLEHLSPSSSSPPCPPPPPPPACPCP